MSAPIVRLVDVVKRFGSAIAVDGVSLEIEEGEFFSLLGPSGSGKTTLLRMIGGFEQQTSGDVFIAGQSMKRVPPERRPVNTVFQSYALFPTKSCFDNVAYGLRVRGVRGVELRDQVDQALALVQLEGFGDRSTSSLSGGQRQRIALARSLVLRPRVLLLDEPLGALDLNLRRQMQYELKRIQHEVGITFIYVTHDQEEALTLGDRIAIMQSGRIEQVGTSVEVYQRPATGFVARFLGETNVVELRSNGSGRARFGRVTIPGVAVPEGFSAFSLRPEAIVVGESAATCPVRIAARIDTSVFLGASTRYTIRLAEAPDVLLIALKSSRSPLPAGAEVEIGIFPEDLVRIEQP